MKKSVILLTLLFSCLSTTSCSCSCHKKRAEITNEFGTNNQIGTDLYSQLARVAVDPSPSQNIKREVYPIVENDINFKFVCCLNSELFVKYTDENDKSSYTLQNFKTGSTIANLGNAEYLGTNVTVCNYVYYHRNVPMVLYATIDGENLNINYLNCYGDVIFTETRDTSARLQGIDTFTTADKSEMYVSFRYYNTTRIFDYFKVSNLNKKDEKVVVTKISADEYDAGEINSDYLSPRGYVDSKGNVFAYIDDKSNLYNANKELIGQLDFSLFKDIRGGTSGDMVDGYERLILEKKILYFKNYNSLVNDSYDKDGFTYIEWDLVTGRTKSIKVKGPAYSVGYSETIVSSPLKFQYTYVKMYKIKENPEEEVIAKCALLKEDFSPEYLIDYFDFVDEIYKVNSDYVLAKFYDEWHLVSKTSNVKIDAKDIQLFSNNQVYLYKDGSYYLTDKQTLINCFGVNYKNNYEEGSFYKSLTRYYYISLETYNGIRTTIYYDEENEWCYSDTNKINPKYNYYATVYGLFIDDYCVRDQKGNVLMDYTNVGTITAVNPPFSNDDKDIFEVRIKDNLDNEFETYFVCEYYKE